jgi:hypothetical protein
MEEMTNAVTNHIGPVSARRISFMKKEPTSSATGFAAIQ